MPISGDQCMDKNDPDYGLPMDTCCVGDGGPSPTEVTNISGSTGKKTSYSAKSVPVGYDGP
jgi:hypothetical protein